MKRSRILPLGTPDEPRRPHSIHVDPDFRAIAWRTIGCLLPLFWLGLTLAISAGARPW